MNATLSIEMELLEPLIVTSAAQMLDLHPTQIRWISIRLKLETTADENPITFSAQADDSRMAIDSLVSLAQRSQPEGTSVVVWFQGRAESFQI